MVFKIQTFYIITDLDSLSFSFQSHEIEPESWSRIQLDRLWSPPTDIPESHRIGSPKNCLEDTKNADKVQNELVMELNMENTQLWIYNLPHVVVLNHNVFLNASKRPPTSGILSILLFYRVTNKLLLLTWRILQLKIWIICVISIFSII